MAEAAPVGAVAASLLAEAIEAIEDPTQERAVLLVGETGIKASKLSLEELDQLYELRVG